MRTRFHDLLATIDAAAALPHGLFDGAAVERLRGAAACLPAALTSCIYFECRLLGALERVDFTVRVDAPDHALLAATCPPLARFARQWNEGALDWPLVPWAIWLEFDLPAPCGVPAPRVFLDYAPPGGARPHASPEVMLPAATLIGAPLPPELGERLDACFDALPAGASLPYVGLADLAAWRPIRLCIAGLSGAALDRVLRAVAWPGRIEAIVRQHARLIARLAPAQDRVGLVHIDIAPAGSPCVRRVGLEYGIARFPPGRLLDAIVEEGLGDPRRRSALDTWPGQAVRVLPHQIWPTRTVRRINHIKIVHDEHGVVEVKAYLTLSHRFHSVRGALRRSRPGSSASVPAPSLPPGPRHLVDLIAVRSLQRHRRKGRAALDNKEQTMTAVLARAAVDRGFRQQLLIDPRAALQATFALVLPRGYNIQFVERAAHLDALVVLPDFKGDCEVNENEIDDRALEAVNGGSDGDGSWSQDDGQW